MVLIFTAICRFISSPLSFLYASLGPFTFKYKNFILFLWIFPFPHFFFFYKSLYWTRHKLPVFLCLGLFFFFPQTLHPPTSCILEVKAPASGPPEKSLLSLIFAAYLKNSDYMFIRPFVYLLLLIYGLQDLNSPTQELNPDTWQWKLRVLTPGLPENSPIPSNSIPQVWQSLFHIWCLHLDNILGSNLQFTNSSAMLNPSELEFKISIIFSFLEILLVSSI